jgi:hypothetical protein
MVLGQRGAAGGGAWVSEGWRVAAQGDQRGGIALDWCGDWLVVVLRKRNMKSVGILSVLLEVQGEVQSGRERIGVKHHSVRFDSVVHFY